MVNYIKKLEKLNLSNISTNLFKYLSDFSDDNTINIRRDYYYRGFNEYVRINLLETINLYNIFVKTADEESKKILESKKSLISKLEEIVSNEQYLKNFTIYKIQQFINSIMRKLFESIPTDRPCYVMGNENLDVVSHKEKYIIYRGKKIDISDFDDYNTPENIATYLYSSFGLEKTKFEEFKGVIDYKSNDNMYLNAEYLEELNKVLFKAGIDRDCDNYYSYNHPILDDDIIFKYIKDGEVASLKKKKKKELLIRG